MMKWFLTVLFSLALGIIAYIFSGSISSPSEPALGEKIIRHDSVASHLSAGSTFVTVDELKKEPSLANFHSHLAGLDVGGLAAFIDQLNSLSHRTPWQISMRQAAFKLLGEKDPVAALARLESTFDDARERRAVVKRLFTELVKVDLESARELLEGLDDEELKQVAENLIAVAWLKTDRDAALAWLEELRGEESFEKDWQAFVETWGEDDPHSALQEIAASDHDDKKKLREEVLKSWIGRDPDEAIMWIEADLGDDAGAWNDFWLSDPAREFSGSQGEGHFDLLLRHPMEFPHFQQSKMSSFTQSLVRRDPEAARERYETADEKTRKMMVYGLAAGLAETHPEEAVKLFDTGDPDYFRGNQLNEVLDHYLLKDPKAAAAWWEALPASDRHSVFLNNIRDPAAFEKAASFASALSNPEEDVEFFESLAERWQQADPVGAMEWAKTLPEGNLRNEAMLGAFKNLAETDPESALATALAATDVGSRGRMMAEAASKWAMADPEAAVLHAAQLGGASGLRALDAAIETAASTDPIALAELIATQADALDNIDHADAYGNIAEHWAGRDLDGAMEWARTLPEGESRDAGISGIATVLANHDPGAARELLEQLRPGDLRDASFEDVSLSLATVDPAGAFDWALEIDDPEMQLDSLTAAMKHWSQFDPEAATSAINAQRLDPKVINQLRESIVE